MIAMSTLSRAAEQVSAKNSGCQVAENKEPLYRGLGEADSSSHAAWLKVTDELFPE